jgi:hypothetical protein
MMSRSKTTSESVTDPYVATDVKIDDASLRLWTKGFASGLRRTNPDFLTKMGAYARVQAESPCSRALPTIRK